MAEEGQRKICTHCYVGRPLQDFRKNKRVLPSGVIRFYYSSPCRICRRKADKERHGGKVMRRVECRKVGRKREKPVKIRPAHRTSTDKTHAQHLRWTYGLSLESYNEIYDRQGGCCAICRRKPHQMASPKRRRLVVDHDHATDQVRGLLCHECNLALGLFQDKVERLRSALTYLEGWSCHSSNSSESKGTSTAGDSSGPATCQSRSRAHTRQR